jgi:hypothetical protein
MEQRPLQPSNSWIKSNLQASSMEIPNPGASVSGKVPVLLENGGFSSCCTTMLWDPAATYVILRAASLDLLFYPADRARGRTEERRNLRRGATEGDVGRGGASGEAEQQGGGAAGRRSEQGG